MATQVRIEGLLVHIPNVQLLHCGACQFEEIDVVLLAKGLQNRIGYGNLTIARLTPHNQAEELLEPRRQSGHLNLLHEGQELQNVAHAIIVQSLHDKYLMFV